MEILYFIFYVALGYAVMHSLFKFFMSFRKNEKDIITSYDYEMYLKELDEAEKGRKKHKSTNDERANGWK